MLKTINKSIENVLIKRINHFYDSCKLNYKSWLIISLSLFLLDNKFTSYVTFAIMLFVVHCGHYVNHLESSYPFNTVHLYHHHNNNNLSHLLQILLEFFAFLYIILFKHLIIYQYGVNILPFIDEWVVVFCYLLYTSVHNINYSIFHVNKIHEIHHKNYMKNLGPDISDIIFGTKMNPESDLENTDHYILNIICSTLIVLFLKYLFKKIPLLNHVFFTIYFIIMIILIYYTITLYEKEMQIYFTENLEEFIND
jgi:hypothetical protein